MVTDRRCEANRFDDMIFFEASMISTFPGVFDECEDNYEVELVLTKAGVIKPQNNTDSEMCALVIYFSNGTSADAFEERLEAYVKSHTPQNVS